jgi:hypothetical protein
MLELIVQTSAEGWDDDKQEFVEPSTAVLRLEHSLVSLSEWESKYQKAFMSNKPKTPEETMFYIKCMTLNKDVDPEVYDHLSEANLKAINEYITNPMTATTFSDDKKPKGGRTVNTAEVIYGWMIALQIPVDPFQYWHINRHMTLIKVCNIQSQPPKKMGKKATASRYAQLNAQRRSQMNTTG